MKKSVHAFSPSPEMAFAQSRLGRRLGEAQEEGSPANRLIAEYLLRNAIRVTAWSIEDLSAAIPVSTATVSRFARTMGFKGYPDLRAAIAETLQSILSPVEKLRDAIERRPDTSPLAEALRTSLDSVQAAATGLNPERVAALVERLQGARTVYVMGFGMSAHIAGLLTLGLQPFCPQLINVVEFGGTEVAAGRLMNAGEGDLLVAISFPRYAADAVQLAAYARDRGAEVVAITDSPASPLARVAGEVLLAPSAHPVLSSSLTPAVLIVEALLTALMTSSQDNVVQAAKLTDAISAYLVRAEPEPSAKRRAKPASPRDSGPSS